MDKDGKTDHLMGILSVINWTTPPPESSPGTVPCTSDRASKKTDSALASGGLSAAGEGDSSVVC